MLHKSPRLPVISVFGHCLDIGMQGKGFVVVVVFKVKSTHAFTEQELLRNGK